MTASPMETDAPSVSAEDIKAAANQEYKNGNYAEAVKLYSEAIDASPDTPTYYSNRAAALMMMGKYKEAAEDCRTTTTLDPDNIKAYMRAGKCHLNLGNLEESGRQYEMALQRDGANAQGQREYNNLCHAKTYLGQAEVYMTNQQWALARNSVDRAVALVDSANLPLKWNVMMAECSLGQKNYSEASRIVNQLIRSNTQNPDALYLRARVFYGQGENAKTVAHCMEALRCDPDFTKARTLLKKARSLEAEKEKGNTAFKTNNLQEAYDAYTNALAIDEENDIMNSRLYSNRAAVLQKLKKFEEALGDCNKAIELDADFTKVYSRRAACYMELEQYEEAVRDYRRLTDADGSNREYHNLLRKAELELKKSQRKDYYKILGLSKDATDSEIKKAYRKLALQYHPDKNAGDEKAEARFKEIGEAYTVLSDPQKKARFDSGADLEGGMGGGFDAGGVDINDVFMQMFGGGMSGGMGGMGGMGGGRFPGGGGFSSSGFPGGGGGFPGGRGFPGSAGGARHPGGFSFHFG
ncbi:hypothetical protein EC973_003789 [Apophysomyces ossiformis]|uniref:J domain-containing protein n=1 Tax=Apophysomyces ossiformis TaxID=679940 RepID=A0A8H7EM43_9FUNG|nr:hypothetical protein EC973_003789 [Apophysomyces ossiformis]